MPIGYLKKLPSTLFKTTVIIWSEYNPSGAVEIEDLARDATSGEAYCSLQKTECVDPRTDKDFDGTDFFGFDEENSDAQAPA